MSAFSSLHVFWQTAIPMILFCEAVLELGLFLYQILRSKKPLRSLPCAVGFVVLITMLYAVTRVTPVRERTRFCSVRRG